MNRIEKYCISDNINLYIIKDNKYKTVFGCTFLHRLLKRDETTFNSLLSKMLKNATADYPSMRQLNIYAENLYGCGYDVSISKRGNIQSIVSSVNVIADKFTGESCESSAMELMLDLIFKPYIKNDEFNLEYLINQKNNLADDIDGLINDKRSYANIRCIEEMCVGEPNAVVEIGYKEDFDLITPKSLCEHYNKIIYSSPIDIFVVGDVNATQILECLKKYLSAFNFDISPIKIEYSEGKVKDVKFVNDKLDVNQGKLALGLRTGVNVKNDLYYALLVGNSILGSGAHSKLFNNVREKMSLCYYAYSRLDKYNSLMLIGSGIEFDKYEETKTAILAELDNVKNGNFTDDEMNIAKEYIISSYRSYEDSPGALVDYYVGKCFVDDLPKLDEAVKLVSAVSRDEILKAFENVTLDTIYFLSGKEDHK